MTPEKETELCENVARILANMDNLKNKLDDHTAMDNENFREMKANVALVDGKLDGVQLSLAESRGAAKNRAIFWSLISSGALFSTIEFVRTLWFK